MGVRISSLARLLVGLSIGLASATTPSANAQEVDAVTVRGKLPNEFHFEYEYQEFDEALDPWQLYKFEFTRRNPSATFIARVNRSERFARWGNQYEIDFYPKFRPGTYAYLSAGYSEDSIFPEWRYGAQIYQRLPRSFEISIGARRLEFENSEVDVFTGSIAKYKGNYYVSLQPFLTARSGDDSLSGVLTVRNYYGSSDDYFEFRGSYGERPEEDIFLETETRTTSWSLALEVRNKISDHLVLQGGVGVRDEEVRAGVRRESLELSAGIRRRF
jgi:YaiO family outer membrane protein